MGNDIGEGVFDPGALGRFDLAPFCTATPWNLHSIVLTKVSTPIISTNLYKVTLSSLTCLIVLYLGMANR